MSDRKELSIWEADLVLEQVDETAIFRNEGGGVSIIQRCSGEESIICFPLEGIPKIINALRAIKKGAKHGAL